MQCQVSSICVELYLVIIIAKIFVVILLIITLFVIIYTVPGCHRTEPFPPCFTIP